MNNLALNPIVLPADGTPQRRHIVPAKYRLEGYDDTYDFRTLAYDVIWIERQKALLFVCPKLLNLETVFKQAKITASGETLSRHRIKRYRRHDEVWIACPMPPLDVTLDLQEISLYAKVSRQTDVFNGKNVLMTKSKDNELPWISDWLHHHVTDQSANAALIFDNGSTQYPLSDLQQTMETVAGLDIAVSVASDFPFGSWKATKLLHRSMFYQTGMLRLRTHNQNMTVAASAIAERKTVGDLS